MPPGARLCLTTPTYVPDCVSDGRRPGNIRTSSTQLSVCAIVASARHSPLAVASVLAHLSSTIKQLPARSGAGYGSHQRGPSRFSNPLTVPVPALPNPPQGPAASYSSQPAAELETIQNSKCTIKKVIRHSEEHSDEESVSSAYGFLTALRLSFSDYALAAFVDPFRST